MLNNNPFWIELIEFPNGLEKLSCKINGQHYVGFLDWREKLNLMVLFVNENQLKWNLALETNVKFVIVRWRCFKIIPNRELDIFCDFKKISHSNLPQVILNNSTHAVNSNLNAYQLYYMV